MSSAYRRLPRDKRVFVDGVIAKEKPTHVVRRLRPHLKKPNELACKWLKRPDIQAAIAERQGHSAHLEARIVKLEHRVEFLLRVVLKKLGEAPDVMGSSGTAGIDNFAERNDAGPLS